jgi:hypothetical protein
VSLLQSGGSIQIYPHHVLAALTFVGGVVSGVALFVAHRKFHFWNEIKRIEDDFRDLKIDHEKQYLDFKTRQASAGGAKAKLPFEMEEAAHLEVLDTDRLTEHMELLKDGKLKARLKRAFGKNQWDVAPNSEPSEIDEATHKKKIVEATHKKRRLTPAIILGGIGTLIATGASIWSLYVL